ncbi:MAG: efflux RND transporter periplasmic adaptor subunit [Nitrospiria bacterium]
MADQRQKTRVRMLALIGGALIVFAAAVGWWMIAGRLPASDMAGMPMPKDSGGDMAGMDMGGPPAQVGRTAVTLTPARRQAIGVRVGVVESRPLATTIRAVGTVAYDERRLKQVNLRVAGWVTHLAVDYTGQPVRAGEPLLTVYSPELASTQAEYRLALRTQERVEGSAMDVIRTGADAQVRAARERLRRLNLSDEQIDASSTGAETTLVAPISGIVTKRLAVQGAYATPETPLYEIADLSTVWVHAQVYEQELAQVAVGQEAEVTLAAYPGEKFRGRVAFIDPALTPETRTARVRLDLPNPNLRLKPGMYGDVTIGVGGEPVLAVPREAVLESGTRTLAFLDRGEGRFEPREISTGRTFDGYTEVLGGLQAGDQVVTSGTFLIDSESQLMAATNMMGALGMGGVPMEQARMGEMEMGGMEGMQGMEGMKGMDMKDMPGMPIGAAADTPSTQTVGGLTLTLETVPAPPKKGENVVRVTVRTNNASVTDASVTLAYTMAMPGMEVETVPAAPTKAGVHEATVDLGMKGGWTIDVTVTRPDAQPVKAHFTVGVK